LGASYGHPEGTAGLPSGNGYLTDGVQSFFTYNAAAPAGVTADGAHWRLSPQAYCYSGPFGLLGEYVISSQKLRQSGPAFLIARNAAWKIEAGGVLTGEEASYKSVTPRKDFDPRQGGWGALEVVGRYGVLDIDNGVFRGPNPFADPASSATKATAWGLGLNWYLNKNVRAGFNYFHTDFDGGKTGSNPVTKQDENVFLTRVQLAF